MSHLGQPLIKASLTESLNFFDRERHMFSSLFVVKHFYPKSDKIAHFLSLVKSLKHKIYRFNFDSKNVLLKEARFRALEILWRTQISLSCSSKRWRFFQLISALLKASRKEKWLYPTCAIRKGEKDGEKVNVTSSTLSKDSAVHKRFSEIYWSSQNLHWWCSWKNGLVQLLQSREEEKENQRKI